MPLKYNGKLKHLARHMRKTATPQENKLWYQFLRKYPLRFQRQKIIGDFIADFYCHVAKLALELDGSQHRTEAGMLYDEKRTTSLEEKGIFVLRFSNHDIEVNFDIVCAEIDCMAQLRLKNREDV